MTEKDIKKIGIFGILTIIAVAFGTYGARYMLADGTLVSSLTPNIGIGLIVIGIIYTIMEKKMNLPYFYGKSQTGGSNANSFVVIGVGCGLFGNTITRIIVITFVAIVVAMSIRGYIGKRYKEKNENNK